MEESILNNNRLIAEFMGATFSRVDYFGSGDLTDEIKFIEHPSALINGTGRTFSSFKDLRYHESFDWLMPVVEKIASLGFRIEMLISSVGNNVHITDGEERLNIVAYSRAIGAVWQAVTQFLEWYNSETAHAVSDTTKPNQGTKS